MLSCLDVCFRSGNARLYGAAPATQPKKVEPGKAQASRQRLRFLDIVLGALLRADSSTWQDRLQCLARDLRAQASLFTNTSDASYAVAMYSTGPLKPFVSLGLVDGIKDGSSHHMLYKLKKPLVHRHVAPLQPLPVDWQALAPYGKVESVVLLPLLRGEQLYGSVQFVTLCEDAVSNAAAVEATESWSYDMDELERLSQVLSISLLRGPNDVSVLQLLANAAALVHNAYTLNDAVSYIVDAVQACLRLSVRLELECLPAIVLPKQSVAAFFQCQPQLQNTAHSSAPFDAVPLASPGPQYQPTSAVVDSPYRSPSRGVSFSKWDPPPAPSPAMSQMSLNVQPRCGSRWEREGDLIALLQQHLILKARGGQLAGRDGPRCPDIPRDAIGMGASVQGTATQLQSTAAAAPNRVRATIAALHLTLLAQQADLLDKIAVVVNASNAGAGGSADAVEMRHMDDTPLVMTDAACHTVTSPSSSSAGPRTLAARIFNRHCKATTASRLWTSNGALGCTDGDGYGCGFDASSHTAASSAPQLSTVLVPNCATLLVADERQPYRDILLVQRLLPHARAHGLALVVSGQHMQHPASWARGRSVGGNVTSAISRAASTHTSGAFTVPPLFASMLKRQPSPEGMRSQALLSPTAAAPLAAPLAAPKPAVIGSPGAAAYLALYLVATEAVPRVILEQAAEDAQLLVQVLHLPLFTALGGPRLSGQWARMKSLILSKANNNSFGEVGGIGVGASSPWAGGLQHKAPHFQSPHGGHDSRSDTAVEGGFAPGGNVAYACTIMRNIGAVMNTETDELASLSVALETPGATASGTGTLSLMISSMRDMLVSMQLDSRPDTRNPGLQDIAAVQLIKAIGRGGQGLVFKGSLYNRLVAIKIIPSWEEGDPTDVSASHTPSSAAAGEGRGRSPPPSHSELVLKQQQRQKRWLVRDALEVAVTSTISHPHIVQVLTFFTDVLVVEYGGEHGRYRLMAREEVPGPKGAPNTAIVMELCDCGSMKKAIDSGCFRLPPGSSTPQVPALIPLLTSLLEVASALRHLHAHRLVHCDVKTSNVLLRSCNADIRGWTCKLSDFGCVRLLSEVDPRSGQPAFHCLSPVGSLAYMAPETLDRDTFLDASVDIYSFGMLMWEAATGQIPYHGISAVQLPGLVRRGSRPSFPAYVPHSYRQVACLCWSHDPRCRPTAAGLMQLLEGLLADACCAAQLTAGTLMPVPAPPAVHAPAPSSRRAPATAPFIQVVPASPPGPHRMLPPPPMPMAGFKTSGSRLANYVKHGVPRRPQSQS